MLRALQPNEDTTKRLSPARALGNTVDDSVGVHAGKRGADGEGKVGPLLEIEEVGERILTEATRHGDDRIVGGVQRSVDLVEKLLPHASLLRERICKQ